LIWVPGEFSVLTPFNKILIILSTLVILNGDEASSFCRTIFLEDRLTITLGSEALPFATFGSIKDLSARSRPFLGHSVGAISVVHSNGCFAHGAIADSKTARSAVTSIRDADSVAALIEILAVTRGLVQLSEMFLANG
jgi:hypothetical protein